eukprot:Filipodium_phascolosomae@DN498_c0_g1_i1.p1
MMILEDEGEDLKMEIYQLGDGVAAILVCYEAESEGKPRFGLEILTEEHHAHNEAERSAIGPDHFEETSDGWRLQGILAVTRAFGNYDDGQKLQGLTTVPQVVEMHLSQAKGTPIAVVMFSDGVLDALKTNSKPLEILAAKIAERLGAVDQHGARLPLEAAARDIVVSLCSDEFEDDTTILIIPVFDNNGIKAPLLARPRPRRLRCRTLPARCCQVPSTEHGPT